MWYKWEHNNYGQYDHNACHDRNYDDSQYMEYQEPPYHEESRPYHEHRDPRDQAYRMRGRHESGYQKDFRGGYQQIHGESGRYQNLSESQRKKYPYKGFKPQMKESDVRMKTSTEKPVEPGAYKQNPSETKTVPSQDNNLAQEPAKPAQHDAKVTQQVTKTEDNNKKHKQDETKPVQNGAKPAQVSAAPTKEDAKLFSENKKPSEGVKPLDKGANPAKEEVKVEQADTKTEIKKHSREPGGWADMSSDSKEAAGPSTKRHPEPVVNYGLSHTAQELRKAFILAKKEEIELAFSQDCRTFACVASTLLKKDPSLEVAVSNALRSTLQDIAGHCVQELSKFIDHYDNIPVNVSERLQNSDI
ncbi:PREDICTED: periphilin-1-like [Nanorana parkeri]|uniref:periphilin-1-like n=1 Tax=Nanorana parkeri TaxID=125878 RepID=UPI0008542EEC|nr:PREDICTED: periphilin-1-like [Nanorana parkeri]